MEFDFEKIRGINFSFLTFVTFINVNIAFGSNETFGAIASITSIDHARLTN